MVLPPRSITGLALLETIMRLWMSYASVDARMLQLASISTVESMRSKSGTWLDQAPRSSLIWLGVLPVEKPVSLASGASTRTAGRPPIIWFSRTTTAHWVEACPEKARRGPAIGSTKTVQSMPLLRVSCRMTSMRMEIH